MQPYSPRETRFVDIRRRNGWSLKVYSIRHDRAEPMDWDGFNPAIDALIDALPQPEAAAGRPGLGFIIAHQGRTGDYTVLGWWNSENELPLSILVRRGRSEPWRRAAEGESICVWDLEVIWAERGAWVESMLTPAGKGVAYLDSVPESMRQSA